MTEKPTGRLTRTAPSDEIGRYVFAAPFRSPPRPHQYDDDEVTS